MRQEGVSELGNIRKGNKEMEMLWMGRREATLNKGKEGEMRPRGNVC